MRSATASILKRLRARRSWLQLASLGLVALFSPTYLIHAQTVQPRPVARLVSSTNLENSRTRRVNQPTNTSATVASPTLEDANPIERRAFDQTNAERLKHGLQPFVWDPELCRLARIHSESMGRNRFFSHATPEGMRLKQRARAAGIRYQVIAENIAYNLGYEDPGSFAVERWMVSPTHRANILFAGFTSMAVGTFVAPDGSVYLTQTFITR